MKFFQSIFFALTRKERAAFLVLAGAALVSFLVVASILVNRATTAIPMRGGSFSEGMVGQPEYVNPVIAASEVDQGLVKMIYANVTDVADNIEASQDGKTWTVHLKKNLTWQDGQKLTSDDVIFTVASIQNPDAKSPLATSWQGVTANRASELELTFSLTSPYAFFGDNLRSLYLIPKHIFADVPPGNWRLSSYNLKPIGSGPYKFVSYDERPDGFIASYALAAWDGAAQKANIGNFRFAFFGNEASLVNSFSAGQIDGLGGVTSADLKTINRPYDLFSWRTSGYYAVFWNQSKNLALQDANVRQALATAIDRDALIASVFGAPPVSAFPDYAPIPPDAPYFSGITASSSADLAAQFLTQAGWVMGASSTFRSKLIQKTSVPLVVNLTVPTIDSLVATAQFLQTAWQSIGVQTNIATDTPQNIIASQIKNRTYESLLFGNVLGPSSDLYSFWHSSQRFSPGVNLAIYQNKTVDSLIESARQNPDETSRAQQFAKAQQAIVADNPALFLYSQNYFYVTNKNLKGISSSVLSDPSDRFRQAPGWYLNTARVLK